jgi:two-component system cell cycle response regulator
MAAMQKVLIADDSIVSRHLLEATLKKWGYDVSVACDGAEAWSALEREDAPSMAILDWVMPVMTGPEVCTKVRQLGRDRYTYILLLTSKNLKEEIIAGMSAGADDYITKPFDQQELQVRMEAGKRILRLHEALFSAQQKLLRQATYDELTGLFNRARILESFRTELARAERERLSVGIVLADIDRFKSINDTYGHNVGDVVLREAARRMHASVRAYDALGRYGGEEFLLVIPGCDLDAAAHQAERLRIALCQEPMTVCEGGDVDSFLLPISASFGATAYYPGSPLTLEALIKLADDALYEAKRGGRNRVIIRRDESILDSTSSNTELMAIGS